MTEEQKAFIRASFKNIREQMSDFMTERAFEMSNAQLFTFLSFAPNALAIASDGQVDESEVAALEKIAPAVNVKKMVNMELMEYFSVAIDPENVMLNEEFNLRAGAELLYLSRNMQKYEAAVIESVKFLLNFDTDKASETSMTKSFSAMMDKVVEMNMAKNKEEEMAKLSILKEKIGV